MNREQIIRDTAYAIWEAEGKPEGRAEEHWAQAERQVETSIAQSSEGAAAQKPARKRPPRKKNA